MRSLVPSWKFFEDIGHTPFLWIKHQDQDGRWSEWLPAHTPVERKLWHLLWNPELNLQLAEKSALQHAVMDLTEQDSRNPVSLEIVKNIAEYHVPSGAPSFHFRISIFDGQDWEDIFNSEESL